MILQNLYIFHTDPVFGKLCPKVYILRGTMKLLCVLLVKLNQSLSIVLMLLISIVQLIYISLKSLTLSFEFRFYESYILEITLTSTI